MRVSEKDQNRWRASFSAPLLDINLSQVVACQAGSAVAAAACLKTSASDASGGIENTGIVIVMRANLSRSFRQRLRRVDKGLGAKRKQRSQPSLNQ